MHARQGITRLLQAQDVSGILRLLLLSLWIAVLSSCSQSTTENNDQLRAELLPTGVLRVAVPVGPAVSPTFAVRDESTGEMSGPTITLGIELAARLNAPLHFVTYSSSGEITAAGAQNEWDVTFIPVDENRAQIIDFGSAYCSFDSTFLIRAGLDVNTIAELDQPEHIAAGVANTTTARAAQAALGRANFRTFSSVDEMRDQLKSGAVDAIALSRLTLTNLLNELPGAGILDEAFNATTTSVAVPKGNSVALAYLSAFVEEVKSNGLARQALDNAGLFAAQVAPLAGR